MMKQTSLNRIYRLIWNVALHQWVVVSEIAKGKGKTKAQKATVIPSAVLVSALFSSSALADPTGGVVTSGVGSINQTTGLTTINQTSQTLGINWQTFNVGAGQTVNFVQPSSTALAINQILDSNGSRILGNIHANGQVWLINPNGVFFGQGSQVNVGSLLASTLNPLSQQGESTQVFGKGGKGSVINKGNIKIADGGYIALIANKVSNQGSLIAPQGTVALAGGSQVTLSFADNELYQIKVDKSTLNNLAENKQLIQADGGAVFLSAGAKQSLLASIVNNEGIIEAQSVEDKEGKIILLAGMEAGTTKVAGMLDASAETGNGGFIETSGAKVQIAENTQVTTLSQIGKTGTWLIDPTNFNIVNGTKPQTTSSVGATTLSNSLNTTDVEIQTVASGSKPGDINVNAAVTWNAPTKLTLTAHRNININKSITAQHANGKLALEYGQGSTDGMINGIEATYNVNAKVNLRAGDNFSTKLGTSGSTVEYKVITSLGAEASMTGTDLQGINGDLSGNYVLGADIDATDTAGWNGGDGFKPLGEMPFPTEDAFNGTFDGLGHVIENLTINRPTTFEVGLFGVAWYPAQIQNVGLVNVNVTGLATVGGLVGVNYGTIKRSYATGEVLGEFTVGGLAGENGGEISNSYFTGKVSAIDTLGGLVGQNATSDPGEFVLGGLIIDGYAKAKLISLPPPPEFISTNKGGLVGSNVIDFGEGFYAEGTIINSPSNSQDLTRILTQIQQHSGNPQTPTPNTLPLTEPSTQQSSTPNNGDPGDDDSYDVIQTYGCSA